ncbi:PH domain-containing protein (plasmid) [Streptomyces sp. NBC_00637]|uniref:PH domain-containing protein n=1 Tax=Streptomyces sp. NBC_00637 TaxID=2903667 RepID=UPI002F90AE18
MITPEQPFTLPDAELTRHPQRTVAVNRVASALAVLSSSALLGGLAAGVATLAYTVVIKTRDWHHVLDWWDPKMALICLLPPAVYAWRWNRIKADWQFRGYHLGNEELYVRNGLLNRSLSVLAYARIQEVTVYSGPIQRRFNLATLTVRSAGGSDVIADLDPVVAQQLRDRLTELARLRREPV